MGNYSKHIILGAGGAIGQVLTDELLSGGEKVKLVSRRGKGRPGTETVSADLTDAKATLDAVDENAMIYLTAGLPYLIDVWRKRWPLIMNNVIAACIEKQARLIFFDDVYMYGRVDGPMAEDTPYKPCSRKGELRAQIAGHLISEVEKGRITAIIARSADFYGPYAAGSSLPYLFVFNKIAHDRKAQVLVNPAARHSYTYTADCGRALYLLASSDDAWNQVWHLPTASPALDNRQFIEIAAEKMGRPAEYKVLKKWMVKLAGLFDKQVGEVHEMLYQNQYDYIFDSSKFEKRFNYTPTPYEIGIAETIDHFRRRKML
jgi:nucleoside-diphosphate-sugar epimerase